MPPHESYGGDDPARTADPDLGGERRSMPPGPDQYAHPGVEHPAERHGFVSNGGLGV